MEVWYVRHGQTDWNKQGNIQGRTDIPLNDTGIKQAYETKALLDNETFDLVISSPLSRAYDTANIICEEKHVEVIKDERLVERNFGIYEGVNIDNFPINEVWDVSLNIVPEGGESIQMLFQRIYQFLDDLKAKHGDSKILLVAHGGIAIPFRCYFEGIPSNAEPRTLMIDNCAYVKYNVDPTSVVDNPFDN